MIIELAQIKNRPEIERLDSHIPPSRLEECIHNGRVYILKDDSFKIEEKSDLRKASVVGVMRYSLFWQTIPFLELLYVDEAYRGRGFGTKMMETWEKTMAQFGYKFVMTSTQANEDAWRFYEKLGYRRAGGFFPPEQDVEEWMYVKKLSEGQC